MTTSSITIDGNENQVQIKRILVTWYSSQEKADLFKKWILENYDDRTVVIEKDDDSKYHWIVLLTSAYVTNTLQIVCMVQKAIQHIPTLAHH